MPNTEHLLSPSFSQKHEATPNQTHKCSFSRHVTSLSVSDMNQHGYWSLWVFVTMSLCADACRTIGPDHTQRNGDHATEECTYKNTDRNPKTHDFSSDPGLLFRSVHTFQEDCQTGSQLQAVCETRNVQIRHHIAQLCRADSQHFRFALSSAT